MELNIIQKSSIKEEFEVFNEYEEKIFTVKKDGIFSSNYRVYDFYNEEVGLLKRSQKFFKTEFQMFKDEEFIGLITKESALKDLLSLDYKNWLIESQDFFASKYRIYDENNDTVGRIEKSGFFKDRYAVEVFDDDDVIDLVMIVVAIDIIKAQQAATAAAAA